VNLLKVQLADYYLENKDFEKAEEIYRQIIQQDVKESDYAFYKLGYLYYQKGDTDFLYFITKKEICLRRKTTLRIYTPGFQNTEMI